MVWGCVKIQWSIEIELVTITRESVGFWNFIREQSTSLRCFTPHPHHHHLILRDFPTLNRMVCLETLIFFHGSHVPLCFTNMDLHVPVPVAGFRECHITTSARKEFLPCMRPLVHSQGVFPCKGHVALIAYIRPIRCMCQHVPIQVLGLWERIATIFADMWLFPRMRAHVLSQVAGLYECLVAGVTYKGLLTSVRSYVSN